MAGEWSDLALDTGVFTGRETVALVDPSVLVAAKQRFQSEGANRVGTIIDREGVTETVFYDKLAALAATVDVKIQLQYSLGTAYLATLYRGSYAIVGNADYDRSLAYGEDLRRELRRFADMVGRALDQDEITFSTTDTTRDKVQSEPVYVM